MIRRGFAILAAVFIAATLPGEIGRASAREQATAPQDTGAPVARRVAPTAVPPFTVANLRAQAWAMLAGGATSDKSQSRSDALSAMTILGDDPAAVAVIEDALSDRNDSIRVLAATSLGDVKDPSAIPELRDALEDRSPEVSFAAAQALWKMGDHSGRNIFFEVLAGERRTKPGVIKSHMNQAMQELHDPKALALIGINEASGAFLGPFSMGVSMLEEYEKDTSSPVQALCAKLLAADNTSDTIEELKYALDDKNWTVRAAAARAGCDEPARRDSSIAPNDERRQGAGGAIRRGGCHCGADPGRDRVPTEPSFRARAGIASYPGGAALARPTGATAGFPGECGGEIKARTASAASRSTTGSIGRR